MYVIASAAVSLDGYLDDATERRLVLSNAADLDRVDEVRAGCDAILVGAGTVRRDDPSLTIKSARRRAARLARGVAEEPAKVTVTASGSLDPAGRFFTTGTGVRLVYCASPALAGVRHRLGASATVVDAGTSGSLGTVLADLAGRGVRRLLVEGGGTIHTQLLTAGLVDELQLAVAPFFVGDPAAPRFAGPGRYPHDAAHPMTLAGAVTLDGMVVLRYLLERPSA